MDHKYNENEYNCKLNYVVENKIWFYSSPFPLQDDIRITGTNEFLSFWDHISGYTFLLDTSLSSPKI